MKVVKEAVKDIIDFANQAEDCVEGLKITGMVVAGVALLVLVVSI